MIVGSIGAGLLAAWLWETFTWTWHYQQADKKQVKIDEHHKAVQKWERDQRMNHMPTRIG